MNSPDTGLQDPWAFFDKIYCISLESRPDRREQAREQFAAAGLLDRVEFIIVSRHPENREEGIFESHMTCLRRGIAENGRHILVFEDDVFFQGLDLEAVREAGRVLDLHPGWQAFSLGCISSGSRRVGKSPLVRVAYRCLAHAYGLNRPFAEQIVRQPWSSIPFDELLRRQSYEFYALYPMCAFQGRERSDNQTVVIDLIRRMCGGLPFIQKMNELYQNHKAVLLPASLTALLGVVLLALRLW